MYLITVMFTLPCVITDPSSQGSYKGKELRRSSQVKRKVQLLIMLDCEKLYFFPPIACKVTGKLCKSEK